MITTIFHVGCTQCLYVNIVGGDEFDVSKPCTRCNGALQIHRYSINDVSSYESLRALHRELLVLWQDARDRHQQELNKYIKIGTPPVLVDNILPINHDAIKMLQELNRHEELVQDFLHSSVYPAYGKFPNPNL